MRGDFDWTEAAIERLRELWLEGRLSTAAIGRELGCGKNAVVGKAHRLGLKARPSPIQRDPQHPAKPRPLHRPRVTLPPLAAAKPRQAPAPVPARPLMMPRDSVAAPVAKPAAMPAARPALRKAEGCRFIAGEGRPWLACDAPCVEGKSWCLEHYRVVFVSPEQARTMWGYKL